MSVVKGDFGVSGLLSSRRLDQDVLAQTITAQFNVSKRSTGHLLLSAASLQDVVLPDATTLLNGFQVSITATGAAGLSVKTYHATTPVLLKTIDAGRRYKFVLVNNSTAAGTWQVELKHDLETVAADRYTQAFNATTDWGSVSGGYYTIVITAATHGKGLNPVFEIFEDTGSEMVKVGVDEASFNIATGDISIRVNDVPDCRFAGKIVVL